LFDEAREDAPGYLERNIYAGRSIGRKSHQNRWAAEGRFALHRILITMM
jgi:hypothetical protein